MNHHRRRFHLSAAQVGTLCALWPVSAKVLAMLTIHRYGQPHEGNEDALTWHENWPWRRTHVHRDSTIEQAVYYPVPQNRLEEVMKFTNHVIIHQTINNPQKPLNPDDANSALNQDVSTITVSGKSEEENVLRLNLIHDIAIHNKTAQEAQEYFDKVYHVMQHGWPEPYYEHLNFGAYTHDITRGHVKIPA